MDSCSLEIALGFDGLQVAAKSSSSSRPRAASALARPPPLEQLVEIIAKRPLKIEPAQTPLRVDV